MTTARLVSRKDVGAFASSVLVGTLAAAWMPLIFTGLAALELLSDGPSGAESLLGTLLLAISPLLVAFAFVLPACILVGVPVTILLNRFGAESLRAYVGIGIIAGLALPLVVLYCLDAGQGWWTALLGAFSGGLTARTWWFSARERIAG